MDRHLNEMLHDETAHEAMKRLAFLVGLAAAIVVLHRILYHLVF